MITKKFINRIIKLFVISYEELLTADKYTGLSVESYSAHIKLNKILREINISISDIIYDLLIIGHTNISNFKIHSEHIINKKLKSITIGNKVNQ